MRQRMQISPETLRDAQVGNAAAFNIIVLHYRRRVIGTVARMIGRPEDAEDVAQEVFTRLYVTLPNLRDPESFEIWLYRMTVNAAYDYLRGSGGRRKRHEARMSEVPEPQLVYYDAVAAWRAHSQECDRQRVHELVEELLANVSEADRILLLLKEVEGLTLQDLEKVYQVNQNALKVRLFRARQRVLKASRSREDKVAEWPRSQRAASLQSP